MSCAVFLNPLYEATSSVKTDFQLLYKWKKYRLLFAMTPLNDKAEFDSREFKVHFPRAPK